MGSCELFLGKLGNFSFSIVISTYFLGSRAGKSQTFQHQKLGKKTLSLYLQLIDSWFIIIISNFQIFKIFAT
jgi:hypothetical protein